MDSDQGGTLAFRLRSVRATRGLSEAQAAREIGVRRSVYDRWERGARPQVRQHAAIAAFLDMSTGDVSALANPSTVTEDDTDSSRRIADLEAEVLRLKRELRRTQEGAPETPEQVGPGADWLNIGAPAKYLGVAERTVYRLIDQDGLPGYRFGRLIRLKRTELDGWLCQQQVTPGSMAHLYPGGVERLASEVVAPTSKNGVVSDSARRRTS